MTVHPPARMIPYPSGRNITASREFYVEALGLEVTMENPVLCLSSPANPSAQVILSPPGFEDPTIRSSLSPPQSSRRRSAARLPPRCSARSA
jgi:hypothetical protein